MDTMRDRTIDRRSVLRLGGGLTLGAVGVAAGLGGLAAPAGAAPAGAAPAAPRMSPDTRGLPAWATRWPAAIRSLDDYTHHCPSHAFPHNNIMVTIDDGPSPEWTPKYLQLFKQYKVKATFCLIGANAAQHPNVVREIHAHHHRLANHSWSHPLSINSMSFGQVDAEVSRTSDLIHSLTGFHPRQFRAPGGNWSPTIFDVLAKHHMMPLGWDIDPRDWARPGVSAIESAMLAATSHNIILCHDGGGDRSETFAALQYVIPRLKDRGWRFVTLPAPQTLYPPHH